MQQFTFAAEVDNKFGEFDAIMNQLEQIGEPIRLHISSPGGEIGAGLAFSGRVRLCKVPITTVAFGHVCSEAVAMFVCGDKRHMEKDAWLMLHETQLQITDEMDMSTMEEWIRQVRRFDEQYYRILADHSKKPVTFWRKLIKGKPEVWLTATQALDYGLCDKII
jgi:ATP-dependent Clp protease protease subunit